MQFINGCTVKSKDAAILKGLYVLQQETVLLQAFRKKYIWSSLFDVLDASC